MYIHAAIILCIYSYEPAVYRTSRLSEPLRTFSGILRKSRRYSYSLLRPLAAPSCCLLAVEAGATIKLPHPIYSRNEVFICVFKNLSF